MPNKPDDIRELWQTQEEEKMTITLDEIRRRSTCFERKIRNRNLREYIAGAVVIPILFLQGWYQHGWRILPDLLLIAGTLYMMLQLHRRGSLNPVPPDAGIPASLRLYRAELERQRDALRNIWSWYLLPFVPGLIATMLMAVLDHRVNAIWYICLVAFPLAFAFVWRLNYDAARRIDAKIEELKSLE